MSDHLSIGPSPTEETCAQLGKDGYPEAAREECKRFTGLLRQVFGPEPPGASLHIHSNPHDFGTYYEVCVKFDADDQEAARYAYRIEAHTPQTWDVEQSKADLLYEGRVEAKEREEA